MRKPIKGFEGIYEVSEEGEIISLGRELKTPTTKYISKERKTKGYKTKRGYFVFDFRSNGGKCKLVHRVVAEAFIPNPENKPQINHKNGIKTDNRVCNLEWCDNSENQIHAFANGFQKGNFNHPNSKLKYEDVIFIKNNYEKGVLGKGVRCLAKKFNVSVKTIQQIINGKSYKTIS